MMMLTVESVDPSSEMIISSVGPTALRIDSSCSFIYSAPLYEASKTDALVINLVLFVFGRHLSSVCIQFGP